MKTKKYISYNYLNASNLFRYCDVYEHILMCPVHYISLPLQQTKLFFSFLAAQTNGLFIHCEEEEDKEVATTAGGEPKHTLKPYT